MRLNRRDSIRLFGGGLGLAFFGAPSLSFGQGSDTLTVAMDEIPKKLDPLLYQTNPGYRTMLNVFDTLINVDYGGDGSLKPGLAKSWSRVDGKTLDLTLRTTVSSAVALSPVARDAQATPRPSDAPTLAGRG